MNGFGNFIEDPLAQFGLGILAANRPGASFGQAVGQGGLTASENMQRMAALKEQSGYRKLQAEQMREKIKREAEIQAQMERDAKAMQEYIAAHPEYADLYQTGGREAVADILKAQMTPAKPDKLPEKYRLWQLSGSPGSFADWYQSDREKGGIKIDLGLGKPVKNDLQGKVISADTSLSQLDKLIADVEANPAAVGGIPKALESGSGWLGQIGAQGIPFLSPMAEAGSSMLSTSKMVDDPTAPGGKREVSAQTIGSGHQLMVNMIKPMVADKGALSNQDQARLDFATANLDSADYRQRLSAYRNLREVIANNRDWYIKILKGSGAGVPGEAGPAGASDGDYQSQIMEAIRALSGE